MNPRNDDNPRLPQPDDPDEWRNEYEEYARLTDEDEDRDDDTH